MRSVAEVFEHGEVPTSPPETPIESIPHTIRDEGRVAGFERLRDMLLENWKDIARTVSLPSLLKMVLETDRHALFALVAEEKMGERDTEKQKLHKNFQDYLKGKTDVAVLGLENIKETPEESNG